MNKWIKLRLLTDLPLMAIGECVGGRDHSTVLHSCNRVANLIAESRSTEWLVSDLEKRIRETP